MARYTPGSRVRLTFNFEDRNGPADPTTTIVEVQRSDGTIDIISDDVTDLPGDGAFEVIYDIPVDASAGDYVVGARGEGAVVASKLHVFHVEDWPFN